MPGFPLRVVGAASSHRSRRRAHCAAGCASLRAARRRANRLSQVRERVRIVVGFGAEEALTRSRASSRSKLAGHAGAASFLVENKPGASGRLAARITWPNPRPTATTLLGRRARAR